jgi:hypothetical protein
MVSLTDTSPDMQRAVRVPFRELFQFESTDRALFRDNISPSPSIYGGFPPDQAKTGTSGTELVWQDECYIRYRGENDIVKLAAYEAAGSAAYDRRTLPQTPRESS